MSFLALFAAINRARIGSNYVVVRPTNRHGKGLHELRLFPVSRRRRKSECRKDNNIQVRYVDKNTKHAALRAKSDVVCDCKDGRSKTLGAPSQASSGHITWIQGDGRAQTLLKERLHQVLSAQHDCPSLPLQRMVAPPVQLQP